MIAVIAPSTAERSWDSSCDNSDASVGIWELLDTTYSFNKKLLTKTPGSISLNITSFCFIYIYWESSGSKIDFLKYTYKNILLTSRIVNSPSACNGHKLHGGSKGEKNWSSPLWTSTACIPHPRNKIDSVCQWNTVEQHQWMSFICAIPQPLFPQDRSSVSAYCLL